MYPEKTLGSIYLALKLSCPACSCRLCPVLPVEISATFWKSWYNSVFFIRINCLESPKLSVVCSPDFRTHSQWDKSAYLVCVCQTDLLRESRKVSTGLQWEPSLVVSCAHFCTRLAHILEAVKWVSAGFCGWGQKAVSMWQLLLRYFLCFLYSSFPGTSSFDYRKGKTWKASVLLGHRTCGLLCWPWQAPPCLQS